MENIKNTFLANVRHEIRTPLNAINGYSQMLAHATDSTEKQHLTEKISRCSQELTVLIENLIEISELEAGAFNLNLSYISLHSLLEELKFKAQKEAYQKGLSFNISTAGHVPNNIYSDKSRVLQILINLVSNAIKFTESGSIRVEVTTEINTVNNLEIHFHVIDTGIGISPTSQKSLFQNFSQIDESHTRKHSGLGLGLALSRRLARELNGDIMLVRSQIGEGSSFLFKLACDKNQINSIEKNEPNLNYDSPIQLCLPIEADLKNKKILIVDDSLDNIQIFKHILSSVGSHIDTAENGLAAIDKVKNNVYDFILMDIQMPVMNGVEATRKIRSLKYRKPIIALTAFASSEAKINFLKSGFTDLIGKPVTRQSLIKNILYILDRNRNEWKFSK